MTNGLVCIKFYSSTQVPLGSTFYALKCDDCVTVRARGSPAATSTDLNFDVGGGKSSPFVLNIISFNKSSD
jgi:hypothetical protein